MNKIVSGLAGILFLLSIIIFSVAQAQRSDRMINQKYKIIVNGKSSYTVNSYIIDEDNITFTDEFHREISVNKNLVKIEEE